MTHSEENHIISNLLQKWYDKNKRELPWRETRDPYRIWVSEVILQQTRVNQGYDYFLRFVHRFPDITSLADASEQDVLKLWQGLGYYSRARNLHAAAKQLKERFNGQFPQQYADIISLKGIGEYTAAAIASIAYNQPHAVVDGNVLRVIARLFKVEEPINSVKGKKIITDIAHSILDEQHPAIHNQAIMDFGAMICTPQQPKCADCILQANCLSFADGSVLQYPVKIKAKKSSDRYFHYFHIIHQHNTFLHHRNASDIWKNLFEFPLIETNQAVSFDRLQQTEPFRQWFGENSSALFSHVFQTKHVLSHQNIHAVFYHVVIPDAENVALSGNFLKIPSDTIDHYPVSRLIHKYLERFRS